MKVFIWIGCLFANSVVVVLFGYAGILLGAVPTMLLYGATFWLASTLCRKWDLHTIYQTASSKHITPFDVISGQIPLEVLHECEDHRRMPFELNTILKRYRRRHQINGAHAEILLEEYMRTEPRSYAPTPPQSDNAAVKTPSTDRPSFCGHCGAAVVENGRFCNKCGTPYPKESDSL